MHQSYHSTYTFLNLINLHLPISIDFSSHEWLLALLLFEVMIKDNSKCFVLQRTYGNSIYTLVTKAINTNIKQIKYTTSTAQGLIWKVLLIAEFRYSIHNRPLRLINIFKKSTLVDPVFNQVNSLHTSHKISLKTNYNIILISIIFLVVPFFEVFCQKLCV